ncbi:DUF6069 family protein [Streptomyces carminius]|uniref:DUF6069 family protein n=1 Tax=Streptomyces carminius TaxID=2665496 RepID=UPI0018EB1C43|nr:DUF6069 family protein [Streptomyces carminius]
MPVGVHGGGGFLHRAAARRPAAVIVGAVAAALGVNLALWLIGLGFDGSFQYVEADGSPHTTTAPQGVITMTVLPMSGGLALAALLAGAGKRRLVLRSAQAVGAGAALATTARTFTAGFDTPSTIALSVMHVVIAVLVVLALEALARRQRAGRAGPVSGNFAPRPGTTVPEPGHGVHRRS